MAPPPSHNQPICTTRLVRQLTNSRQPLHSPGAHRAMAARQPEPVLATSFGAAVDAIGKSGFDDGGSSYTF